MVALIGLRKNLSAPNRAPRWPLRLNTASQQTKGLIAAWPIWALRGHNLVNGGVNAILGAASAYATGAPFGTFADLSTNDQGFFRGAGLGSKIGYGNPWTLIVEAQFVENSGLKAFFNFRDVTNSLALCYWDLDNGQGIRMTFRSNSDGQTVRELIANHGVGGRHVYGFSHSGVTSTVGKIYVNGIEASKAGAPGLGGAAGPDGLDFNQAAFNIEGDMNLYWALLYNRQLPDAEHYDIAVRNKWGWIEQPGQVTYFAPEVVGGGDTPITADAGVYSITGFAASFLWDHKMPAAQGSYTYTGFASNLLRGYTLTAAQGSYVYTGISVNTLWGHLTTVDVGSYIVTGIAAVLHKGYTLLAVQGSYTISGKDVVFLRSHVLNAEKGTYLYTGFAANTVYSEDAGGSKMEIRRRRRL